MCERTSATNCARIYNSESIGISSGLPLDWPLRFEIDTDGVSDAFYLYSLLMDHHHRGISLQLLHHAFNNADRIRPVLHTQNLCMAGTGQLEWNHACESCTKVFSSDTGLCELHLKSSKSIIIDTGDAIIAVMHSAVTDGVTLGHPCCAVHDCQEALSNNHQMFCNTHQSLQSQCSVEGCVTVVEPGFRTCIQPDHHALEEHYLERGKAMFQLKQRLENLQGPQELSQGPDDEEVVGGIQCDGKPEVGKKKLKAHFGQRHTHNEQLCVASCGIILGRATFYGAEGLCFGTHKMIGVKEVHLITNDLAVRRR